MVMKVCRVLVVEDRPDVQELLKDLFEAEGFRFIVVSNGVEMRKILARSDVDVAVIDVVLPGAESGLDLAKDVAARGCAVILVTGNHAHFETVESSGHRFLFKPFRLNSLMEAIDEALHESKIQCRARNRLYGGMSDGGCAG